MGIPNWLKHTADPDLQTAAHQKIKQFQELEQHIPGVIIIHNLADDSIVYLSERGRNILNVSLEEIRLPHTDYHKRFFNPEDVPNYAPKILGMIQRNADDEIIAFFQQVRPSPKSEWTWFSSSIKILLRDKENKPLLAVTIAVPIDAEHYFTPKIERLIEENKFLREKQQVFSCLSKREKEVLILTCQELTIREIGVKLSLSENTIRNHRVNIMDKVGVNNMVGLVKYAYEAGLIH